MNMFSISIHAAQLILKGYSSGRWDMAKAHQFLKDFNLIEIDQTVLPERFGKYLRDIQVEIARKTPPTN